MNQHDKLERVLHQTCRAARSRDKKGYRYSVLGEIMPDAKDIITKLIEEAVISELEKVDHQTWKGNMPAFEYVRKRLSELKEAQQ